MLVCDVLEPTTGEPYNRDPRGIAKKAEGMVKSMGVGDTIFFGPEAEFFVFDDVKYAAEPYNTGFKLDSIEFPTNSDTEYEGGNLGHRIGTKKGYFPVPPQDSVQDMRSEMLGAMARMGVKVEKHHHEVASAQHELGLKFSPLTQMADLMQIYKYCIQQVAQIYGKTATFMPKPIYGDNGSGMHCHQSIWKAGKPVFAGNKYADLSETCLSYIAGIIKHAKAINAFTNPTTNSYKRLVPGFEAPVLLAYSARNRSASCRIPYTTNPKAKRVEVRFPDPLANPYLAFAAMLMAGLDGIKNKLDPGAAMDKDLYDLPPNGTEEDPDGVRLAARGARRTRQGPRLPQGRRRVRRRLHRQLHRAEDDGSDPLRAHPASGRIRDVLLGVSVPPKHRARLPRLGRCNLKGAPWQERPFSWSRIRSGTRLILARPLGVLDRRFVIPAAAGRNLDRARQRKLRHRLGDVAKLAGSRASAGRKRNYFGRPAIEICVHCCAPWFCASSPRRPCVVCRIHKLPTDSAPSICGMPHIKSSYGYGLGSFVFASSFAFAPPQPATRRPNRLFFQGRDGSSEPHRLAYLML